MSEADIAPMWGMGKNTPTVDKESRTPHGGYSPFGRILSARLPGSFRVLFVSKGCDKIKNFVVQKNHSLIML